jgi:hypothetical protein
MLEGVLIIKATECTNFSDLFWYETLHVSDSPSVYHQEFFTVHTAVDWLGGSVGIATDYGLDGPGIESRWV